MKNSTKVKAGLLLTSLACAAGATAALVMLQKKREEEVYHEAELKAMDELEEMMRAESDCASCACAEECADTSVYQDAFDDAPKAAEPAAEEPQAEAEEERGRGRAGSRRELTQCYQQTDGILRPFCLSK